MIGITSNVMESWNRSRGSLASRNQAKLALDQLENDLEGLLLRKDGNVWFVVSITRQQPSVGGDAGISDANYTNRQSKPGGAAQSLRLNPSANSLVPPIEELRFGHIGVWLRFFSIEADSNVRIADLSGPRAISYQIARVPDRSGLSGATAAFDRRYFLYRSTARAAPLNSTNAPAPSTFGRGYNLLDTTAYRIAGITAATNGEPDSIRRPDRTAIIASDVVDFGVRVFVAAPDGRMVERFPVDRSDVGDPTPPQVWAFVAYHGEAPPIPPFLPYPTIFQATDVAYGTPSEVEVFVRVLTEEGASTLRGLENPSAGYVPGIASTTAFADRWWEIAIANSEVYSRRIKVRAVGIP